MTCGWHQTICLPAWCYFFLHYFLSLIYSILCRLLLQSLIELVDSYHGDVISSYNYSQFTISIGIESKGSIIDYFHEKHQMKATSVWQDVIGLFICKRISEVVAMNLSVSLRFWYYNKLGSFSALYLYSAKYSWVTVSIRYGFISTFEPLYIIKKKSIFTL